MDMYLCRNTPRDGGNYTLTNYMPYASPKEDVSKCWWFWGFYRTKFPIDLTLNKEQAEQICRSICYKLEYGEVINLTTRQVTFISDAEVLPPASTIPL